jgi:Ribbon-helix-helix protein, copG family
VRFNAEVPGSGARTDLDFGQQGLADRLGATGNGPPDGDVRSHPLMMPKRTPYVMHMKHKRNISLRLTDRQIALLQEEADRLDITMSEMIRKIIDAYLEQKES